MAKLKHTIRFAFGTPDMPGSAIWRAFCNGKAGDVYLQNAPQLANTVHVSLHASGRFSFKLGDVRHKLEPPFEYAFGCYFGLFMFFRSMPRPTPPTAATGKVDLINWLGFPANNSLFIIKLIYTPQSGRIVLNSDESLIGQIANCRLYHKPMMLHFVLQHRELSDAERNAEWHVEEIDFGGNNPEELEMIRVTKTEIGPSAIIHQQFSLLRRSNDI